MAKYSFKFIGRKDGLDKFYSLRSLREQKNALYLEAEGGLGKTQLLGEYIIACRDQRRPWHVAPSGVPEIIDFYYLDNRTVGGLRRSISERVGREYFPRFLKIADLIDSKRDNNVALSDMQLASLHQEIDFIFFEELKQALPKIRSYTVLFFDTFEIVYNRSVGRWFLEEFLTNEAVTGYLVVFAGRPRTFDLPVNVVTHKLKVFNEIDIRDYFQQKKEIISLGRPEEVAAEISDGRPLILDLIVHYVSVLKGNIGDLINLDKEDIENKLVSKFLDARDPLHDVIQEMAFLKQRYNRKILEHLHPNEQGYSYEKIKAGLVDLPFVKHREAEKSDEEVFTLHDKFQEMISAYGHGDWKEISEVLYKQVVCGWYQDEIDLAGAGPYKDLLRAEQLAYILDQDRNNGLERFGNYFEEIKKTGEFDFNDMLWGEVAGYIGKDKDAYNFMVEQANWLFDNARYHTAAFWFAQATSSQISRDVARDQTLLPRTRLGNSYLRLGWIDKSNLLFMGYLQEAAEIGNVHEQSVFSYNLGHVRQRQGQWDEALLLYEQAIDFARKVFDMEFMGQILFSAARLRARQGQIEQARKEVERGLPLVEKKPLLHAQTLTYAGDIYRYVDDLVSSENYYNYALSLLSGMKGQYEWSALALSGLGATYGRRGVLTREQRGNFSGDLENQKEAFTLFMESIKLVREHKLDSSISRLLDRIADVYVELNHIKLEADQKTIDELTKTDFTIDLVEEKQWKSFICQREVDFSHLDFLGKAQRLYEVAFLEADRHSEPHSMFDALMQAASISQQRERSDDLEYYATLAGSLQGLDDPRQEKIFFGFLNVLYANVIFRNNPDQAINQYKEAYLEVVSGGRFGEYLAKKQLPMLSSALMIHPKDSSLNYCSILKPIWKDSPLLTDFIQNLEDRLYSS